MMDKDAVRVLDESEMDAVVGGQTPPQGDGDGTVIK